MTETTTLSLQALTDRILTILHAAGLSETQAAAITRTLGSGPVKLLALAFAV